MVLGQVSPRWSSIGSISVLVNVAESVTKMPYDTVVTERAHIDRVRARLKDLGRECPADTSKNFEHSGLRRREGSARRSSRSQTTNTKGESILYALYSTVVRKGWFVVGDGSEPGRIVTHESRSC